MFSSLLAHLTDIIPSLAHLFDPAPNGQASRLHADQGVRVQTEAAPTAAPEGPDRRQLFIGHWHCTGTKVVEGKELPYNGNLKNTWALDLAWLVLDFKETQPAEGKPFSEVQYWGYTEATGIHIRPMMTSPGGFALVTAPGWDGDVSTWTGTYDIGGVTLDLTEIITIYDQNTFNMFGEMFMKGQLVGSYNVTCTRKHNHSPAPMV